MSSEPRLRSDEEPSLDRAGGEERRTKWVRRRSVWGLAGLAVVVGTILLINRTDSGAATAATVELNYGEAVVADLVQTDSFDGTLGTVDGDPVTSQVAGTVTNAMAAGAVAEQGDVLFNIDGGPVVLLYGDAPAYRDLAMGVDSVSVSASLSGTITDVAAPGTALHQGDVIFVISNDPTELELAQMRQSLTSAESQVAGASASYQKLVEEADRADVLTAESAVVQAREGLENLLEPPTDAQILNAQVQVSSASANLNALLEGPSESDIASAQTSVASAQANVESTQRAVDTAMTSLVIALDAYCFHPDQPLGVVCPTGPLSSAERDTLSAAIASDPAGSLVAVTQSVLAADGSYRNTASQLSSALAGLESAQEHLDALNDPASSVAVRTAEAALAAAEENLLSLVAEPTEAAILHAEANLAAAEARLADLLAGASSPDRSQALASLENARAGLDVAVLQQADFPSGAAKTVLLYGTFPAWRALSVDSAPGLDITQLEENLSLLGYDPDGSLIVDEVFDEATAAAVKRWQEDLGVEISGTIDSGEIVFVPGPSQVHTSASLGDPTGSGSPVVALASGEAMTGTDVEQLEAALEALGFDPGPVDGTFTDETRKAVLEWQAVIGLEEDGVVDVGEVVFLDGPVRVSEQLSSVGSVVNAGSPVLAVSSSEKVVRLNLPARNQGLVSVGDEVVIVMPDVTETPGLVTSVATTASVDQGNEAAFEVIVELLDPSVAEGLDEAPVDVEVISESVEGVLAVPVSALVALSEGGYAVRVDAGGGDTRLVAVDPGFFADGLVEITSNEVNPGDRVVVP